MRELSVNLGQFFFISKKRKIGLVYQLDLCYHKMKTFSFFVVRVRVNHRRMCRQMKRIFIILLFLLLVVGCEMRESTLSLADVTEYLDSQGIELTEVEEADIHDDFAFNKTLMDVDPTLYWVNEEEKLSIYVFSSSSEMEEGIEDFENKTATASLVPHEMYAINNLLIFYVYSGGTQDPDIDAVIRGIEE